MRGHRLRAARVHFNNGSDQVDIPFAVLANKGLLFSVGFVEDSEKNSALAVLQRQSRHGTTFRSAHSIAKARRTQENESPFLNVNGQGSTRT